MYKIIIKIGSETKTYPMVNDYKIWGAIGDNKGLLSFEFMGNKHNYNLNSVDVEIIELNKQ
jgi:hypothetical protein